MGKGINRFLLFSWIVMLSGCCSLHKEASFGPPYKNLITPDTQLNVNRTALLVIDAQNDFGSPGGAHPMPDLKVVMPRVVEAIDMFRSAGKPIIHVVRLYKANGTNADMCRRWQIQHDHLRVVVPDTWGSQLVPATNPTGAKLDAQTLMNRGIQQLTKSEFVCYKPRFNGFYDTSLNKFLGSMDIDSVVVVGITFPNCVRATQLGATDHNYRVALVPSACTQVYPDGLKSMQGEGVQLMTLHDLSRFLDLGTSPN